MTRTARRLTAVAGIAVLALAVAGVARVLSSKSLAAGRFHNVAHKGAGLAEVFETADGRRVLRLSDFSTAAAPGLSVLLVAAPDARENETVRRSESIRLGPLAACEGDQEYEVPPDADLTRFRAVTIWSDKYGVNFTTAPLAVRP
jgi:hypothetical protein